MGLLSLFNNVEGNRGSIDFCLPKDHDVVVLVDDSTRMLRKGRWDEVSMAVGKLAARVYKYNKRGIDVHFLNQQSRASVSLKTKSKTRKLLEETTLYYGQPIGARLCDLFDQYVRESCNEGTGGRKRDILIISDGMPSDDLENVLVNIAEKLDELGWPKSQLRIHFIQVGDNWIATQFLLQLEQDLSAKHNIADLVSIELCDGDPLTTAKLEGTLLKSVARHSEAKIIKRRYRRFRGLSLTLYP